MLSALFFRLSLSYDGAPDVRAVGKMIPHNVLYALRRGVEYETTSIFPSVLRHLQLHQPEPLTDIEGRLPPFATLCCHVLLTTYILVFLSSSSAFAFSVPSLNHIVKFALVSILP